MMILENMDDKIRKIENDNYAWAYSKCNRDLRISLEPTINYFSENIKFSGIFFYRMLK